MVSRLLYLKSNPLHQMLARNFCIVNVRQAVWENVCALECFRGVQSSVHVVVKTSTVHLKALENEGMNDACLTFTLFAQTKLN